MSDIIRAHIEQTNKLFDEATDEVQANSRKLHRIIGDRFATVADLHDDEEDPKPSKPEEIT